jgi:cyclophilin family peptidyl-prolyl cis-trans isomerase
MTSALLLLAVLIPSKGWFAPDQPWNVNVRPPAGQSVELVLYDFGGSPRDPDPTLPRKFDKPGVADVRRLFPSVMTAGTYVLYALPAGEVDVTKFVGTPIVFTVREDRRRGAPQGPMVAKAEPLVYAVIATDAGDMTVAFYYDVAPNTAANFCALARDRFYDDLTFHRIEPDFIAQGGDPRGDGTGGPGYTIDAEFSDRRHEVGSIAMARNVDPNESPNNPPRPEYANSAGSQFYLALDAKHTAQLDGAYTVFGKIVGPAGMKTLSALGATPIADPKNHRPARPPVIHTIEVRPVTARENPYRALTEGTKPDVAPEKKDVPAR